MLIKLLSLLLVLETLVAQTVVNISEYQDIFILVYPSRLCNYNYADLFVYFLVMYCIQLKEIVLRLPRNKSNDKSNVIPCRYYVLVLVVWVVCIPCLALFYLCIPLS